MNDAYVVAVDGLDSLDDIADLAPQIARKAQQAINTTTRRRRTSAAREMQQQVAFPARYLSGSSGRLKIDKMASPRSLEARITGRDRPTSLARFAASRNPAASRKAGGVKVTVAPGETQFMEGAFIMKLKGGNLGLAIRLKAGESVRNKKQMTRVGKGLYLLYGPSVNQVFRGVAEDGVRDTAGFLAQEFFRLMEL
jgi:hypothetical protein